MFPVKVMIVFPAVLCSVTPFTCRFDGCDVVLQLFICSMFALFLPHRRLRNLYSLVGIQHFSCLPLLWGPLVLIIDFLGLSGCRMLL